MSNQIIGDNKAMGDNKAIGDNQGIRVHQATRVVEASAEAEGVAVVVDGMGGMAITVLMGPMVLPAGTLLRMETPEIREALEEEVEVEEEAAAEGVAPYQSNTGVSQTTWLSWSISPQVRCPFGFSLLGPMLTDDQLALANGDGVKSV